MFLSLVNLLLWANAFALLENVYVWLKWVFCLVYEIVRILHEIGYAVLILGRVLRFIFSVSSVSRRRWVVTYFMLERWDRFGCRLLLLVIKFTKRRKTAERMF